MVLQGRVRRRASYRTFLGALQEARMRRTIAERAATSIQNSTRKAQATLLVAQRRAAIRIQRHWRGCRARRRVAAERRTRLPRQTRPARALLVAPSQLRTPRLAVAAAESPQGAAAAAASAPTTGGPVSTPSTTTDAAASATPAVPSATPVAPASRRPDATTSSSVCAAAASPRGAGRGAVTTPRGGGALTFRSLSFTLRRGRKGPSASGDPSTPAASQPASEPAEPAQTPQRPPEPLQTPQRRRSDGGVVPSTASRPATNGTVGRRSRARTC